MALTTIRVAAVADAGVVAAFRCALALDERPPGEPLPSGFLELCTAWFAAAFAERRFFAWVADDAGVAVGTAGYLVRELLPRSDGTPSREARVHNVFVEANHRNEGVGEALMRAVLADIAREPYGKISLGARTRARRFYERLGFAANTGEMVLVQ